MLNDRWTDVLAAKEYGLKRPTKNYPKRKLLPQFCDEAQSLDRSCVMLPTKLTDHHVARIERQLKPNTSLHHPTIKAKRQQVHDTLTTYDRTWLIESVRLDQYMDHGCMPQH